MEFLQFELGKRVERLLYFGAIVLALCLIEVYLATTAKYMQSNNPAAVLALVEQVRAREESLLALYKAQQSLEEALEARIRASQVEETRARLGLPAETDERRDAKSYSQAIRDLVRSVAREVGFEAERALQDVAVDKPPDEIIAALEERYNALKNQPVFVWGIETPIMVPVTYGRAQYQVPASVLAWGLFLALGPILVVWGGSFYHTRQKELLVIIQADQFVSIFPHVLNTFPVEPVNHPEQFQPRGKPRDLGRQRAFERFFLPVRRSLLLALIMAPMTISFGYSAVQLVSLQQVSVWLLIAIAFVVIVLFVQLLCTIAQEWLLTWSKRFYI